MSVLSKLLVIGVLAGAGVSVSAVPASAVPSGDRIPAIGSYPWTGSFSYGQGIGLGTGKLINWGGTDWDGVVHFDLVEDADHNPRGMGIHNRWKFFSVRAAYPILSLGQPTEYWVQAGISYDPSFLELQRPYGACEIFRGEPTAGATPVWDSGFQCSTTRDTWSTDYTFTLGRTGAGAEASGVIRTQGPVSLIQGEFQDTGAVLTKAGEMSVGEDGRTSFTAAVATDEPAKVEFQYNIAERGAATPYIVFGGTTSGGEEKCYVLPVGRYECSTHGRGYAHSSWETTFTVTKTQYTAG